MNPRYPQETQGTRQDIKTTKAIKQRDLSRQTPAGPLNDRLGASRWLAPQATRPAGAGAERAPYTFYSYPVRCQDGAVRAWNRSMMLFPPCPLTARDRHQGKLIPPVKRGVIVRTIVTVGPLSPSCRAASGRPARHPDFPQPESTRLGQPATGRPPHCNPRVLAYIKGPRASLVISLAILHLSRRAG